MLLAEDHLLQSLMLAHFNALMEDISRRLDLAEKV